jgi:hypothetical protein
MAAIGRGGIFMRAHGLVGALVVGVAASLVGAQAPPESPVQRLGVEGRGNATPSVAARGAFVAVAWGASAQGAGDVYVAVSRDGGAGFDAPVPVNEQAGEARSGGEMPPRVVLVPPADRAGDPAIVVVWRARTPGPCIRYARSDDGGRSFGAARTVQSNEAAGDRGWHAAAVGDDGRVHAVWLDHRGLAPAPGSGAAAHAAHRQSGGQSTPMDGVAMAQKSSLYYGALDSASPERELTKGVCYCCKTALAAGPAGAVYVAWRHVYPGNIRDIAFITSRDGGRTFAAPVRVSQDRWELAGCPDDGPSMEVDAEGAVHLAWPTVIGGDRPEGALFYASTRDGRTFTPRLRVPTLGGPKPSHPQLAVLADGRIAVAWDEVRDGKRMAALTVMSRDARGGASFSPPLVLDDAAPAAVYPVVAASGDRALVVWTAGSGATSTIGVRRVALPSASGSR